MKVILLAGGFGTRLAEYTDMIPKPMVPVGGKPILWHIMQTYASFGHKDFYVALGYKAEVIKDYFLNYRALNADFTVDLSAGNVISHQVDAVDWKVTLVNTGDSSMTGGRVKRMASYIGNETCMLTYGDGVANIDLEKLLAFHNNHGKMVTISAVRPAARFGELEIEGSKVVSFQEKPKKDIGRAANAAIYVFEPEALREFFDCNLATPDISLDIIPKLIGKIFSYKITGFHVDVGSPLAYRKAQVIADALYDGSSKS